MCISCCKIFKKTLAVFFRAGPVFRHFFGHIINLFTFDAFVTPDLHRDLSRLLRCRNGLFYYGRIQKNVTTPLLRNLWVHSSLLYILPSAVAPRDELTFMLRM